MSRYPQILTLLVALLAGISRLSAAAPMGSQRFEAEQLVQSTGHLAEASDATRKASWEVANGFNFGFKPTAGPGVYRLTAMLRNSAGVAGILHVDASSGNQQPGTPVHDQPEAVTWEDAPDRGNWYPVSRTVRLTRPSHWVAVTATWPGLRIGWISLERVTEPVLVTALHTSRLLYRLRERGTATIHLLNNSTQAQPVLLRVRVESGLDDTRAGAAIPVLLPAPTPEQRLAGTDLMRVEIPLPPLAQYGNAVVVQALLASRVVGELREYCYASDRPMQVGQYFGWHFPDNYTCSNVAEQFERMRRIYFPVAECSFWAPCDNSVLAPDAEKWWSGQTLLRLSQKPLQQMIRDGHAQGYSFISYATRWGFGWRMWEFARRHPELVQWEMGPWQPSYDVAHMEVEERERDEEHAGLSSTGILSAAWGNPEAVQYHVRQLRASMKLFGWDGFRYDNGSPVLDEVADLFGRRLPLAGWTHAKVIRALRDGIRGVKPGGIYGNNTGWDLDPDSRPTEADPYTQQIRDGGMVMQEGETNGTRPHHAITVEASRYARAGYNALRYGGHQVNIIDPELTGPDHFYQAALTVVGSCHVAYGVRDELRPVMQLVCRHADLFYGDGLRFILRPPTPVVEVSAPDGVLWRDFVRYRQISPTRRQYLVHLFNLPPAEKLGDNKEGRYPEAVSDITTRWNVPHGWKVTRAYELTADTHYQKRTLAVRRLEGKAEVTLPLLRRWSVVVLDAQATAPPPSVRRPAVRAQRGESATGGGPSLDGPRMVVSANNPAGATSGTIHFLADEEPAERRAAAFKTPDGQIVRAPGANEAGALRVGPGGVGDLGFAPEVPRPGRYRVTVRAQTLAPPPPNGALSGVVMTAVNEATPGARALYHEFRFGPERFPRAGEWVELTVDADLTFPNYWFALKGGWDGLMLDTIRFTRIRDLDREILKGAVQRSWPANLALRGHAGTRAWFGAGLYYRMSGLPEALNALHLQVDLAKAGRFRGPVGFDRPFPKAPEELAAYDLVVIADCEARSLSPEQQLWLEGFVRQGGCLVLAGGPYAFGCGGWESAQLLDPLLPVRLSRFDLRSTGKVKPVELQAVGEPASGEGWSAHPVLVWQHVFTARPDAKVHVRAGDTPLVVSRRYGQGAVMVVGAAPLGEAPEGATPYWKWPGWSTLMTRLIRDLLPSPNAASGQPRAGQ